MIEQARPFLDLTRYHFKRELGELTIYGVWVPRSDTGNETEPALAIIPRYREIGRPVVVALSAAYLYDNAQYAARRAFQFNQVLGFEPSVTGAIKIADLINDHLSDLVSMPPEPTDKVVVADASIRGSDGRNRSAEIIEHVPARL